ncbi:hypothetical protein QYE76_046643 [Lolium multiflorum]|uniref:Xyloglucan endotransglucosylase/hydrolase n=1 Tax=Lolium multiflorum TaxID=4521 RepID=A0AAD8TNA9_LOLMU|nr:hypothetical protein QYE76_046643 [Lolium multiflorum]
MASNPKRTFVLILCSVLLVAGVARGGNFYQDVDITFGDGRARILDGGNLLTLSMDKASGSGFHSKDQYLFGRFDVKIKLVPGNSAGTVTAFYLTSPPQGAHHDEVDFEFLGNASGQPYTVQTNVFSQGQGNREQQFRMCCVHRLLNVESDTAYYPYASRFYVDGTPIREHRNQAARTGVPFPTRQPMRMYASLWDAEAWATENGRIKTDWSRAPFVASYKEFAASGCTSQDVAACARSNVTWMHQELDTTAKARLHWVQKNHMIYNYCADTWNRFPHGPPPECAAAK